MIILTTAQAATVAGPVSEPRYIVDIELDQPYHLSTRDDVSVNDALYTAGTLKLGKVSEETAELQIENFSYQHTQNAIAGVYMRNPVKIWWAYSAKEAAYYVQQGYWQEGYIEEPDSTEPGVILMFEGIISGTPDIDEWLSITAKRSAPKLFPFAKIRPPVANHAPNAGYSVPFDGALLKIEGGR